MFWGARWILPSSGGHSVLGAVTSYPVSGDEILRRDFSCTSVSSVDNVRVSIFMEAGVLAGGYFWAVSGDIYVFWCGILLFLEITLVMYIV